MIQVVTLLLVFILAAPAAAQEKTAQQWLAGMQEAARKLDYEGVFVYVHGSQIDAMQVVHAMVGGVARERLYSLNGEAREVIRDAEQVWCYLPDRKMGVREYRKTAEVDFPSLLPESVGRLEAGYLIETGSRDRIAGRPAQLVVIRPRDEYRYGYRLWADVDTGLLLRADLVDREEKPVEQYMFTQIEIGGVIPAGRLDPMTPKEALEWHADTDGKSLVSSGETHWSVGALPPGYRLTSSLTRMLPMNKVPVEHHVYSDGLSTVSVFVEMQAGSKRPMEGLSHMGAMHAYGRMIDGYQVTVVGEVPGPTVEMMGRSVTRLRK